MRKSHLFVMAACGLLAAHAQPAPKLNSLSREWLQRDTTSEITFNGENLASAKRIIVSGAPGVKAEIIQPPSSQISVESSGQGISSTVPVGTKALKVRVEIEGSAVLAEREVRVVTANGISNPLPLRLSSLPEVNASENQAREKAQSIALPVVVSGTIGGAAESHFYKFAAKKGEKVILNVDAFRIGSKLDSSLAVLDASGKELARNEDAVGLDSVLEFEPPADGEYLAELRDFSYGGSGEHKYRLTVGVRPHVRSVFPFGGQRGKTVTLRVKGANLGGTSEILLDLAPNADLGQQEVRASAALGLSNPFPFDVTDFPTFAEVEPNTVGQADSITLPVAIDGRINKAGDHDAFKFQAAKDQRASFEVQAFRHGSPVDAVLILTDRVGNVLQRNDDAVGSDAKLDYTFKEAGEYIIIVEDLLNRGGDEYGYRLSAFVPQPDFSVAILPDAPRLRRGGRVPIRVEVNRMNGFNEPVRVYATDLPVGVYSEALTVPPSSGSGFLVLNATADAELDSYPLVIKASAGTLNKTATAFSGDKAMKTSFLTLLEQAPFSIATATLMANIEQSQSGAIQVLVERRPGFSGEVQILPEGFSTGREPITRSFEFQPLTLKGTESSGSLSLKAKPDSEVAVGQIVLRGEATVNGSAVSAYSPLVPVGTLQIPFVLSTTLKRLVVTALPSDSGSAASEAVFAIKVDRRMGFSGEIELAMEGLPEGVTASVPKIAEKESEATIKLQATDKAPTGKEVQLTIRGKGLHKERSYGFAAPAVTLVINAPETEEKKEPKLANKDTTP